MNYANIQLDDTSSAKFESSVTDVTITTPNLESPTDVTTPIPEKEKDQPSNNFTQIQSLLQEVLHFHKGKRCNHQ